ncbi:hypothetical protein WICPIJ_000238 [Wickerhamomyces pijperi]|uniref:Uncharacterized protein n=1 Tax=Wickerhamomyces pijperi TaxID=599730 RepID=A0A9P8QHN0_WICPI|nr:hypothetical protein WICPIJ_000238 [Wickerhamomyces pijperi]
MTLFRFLVNTATIECSFLKSNHTDLPSSEYFTKDGNATEPKLQTATSSGDEYCTISQHRLDDLITPRFF